jgi:hypothetical protein
MKVKSRTTRTYSITGLTQEEANDILNLCVGDEEHVKLDIVEPSIQITLDKVREALLNSGFKRETTYGKKT